MFPHFAPAKLVSGGPICALAVDAEEDFDWGHPVASTPHSTSCMRQIGDLHEIVGAYRLKPTYLLTYPVLQDEAVVQMLRRQLSQGRCELGVQLHPWVNPPFDGDESPRASFSGNLSPGLEEAKLVALKHSFAECFGMQPQIYRAGRYGFGPNTACLLERHGFAIDTSLAPRTSAADDDGPDHQHYDYAPFWFGERRRLLELPLCRSIVGWGGRLAPPAHRLLTAALPARLRASSVAARLRFAERITLSPEGNDLGAMLRLVRHLLARGQKVFVLSFHSSSLAAGSNPYVRTRADLHHFYDRLSAVLHALSSEFQFRFMSLADLPAELAEAPA